jgi:hypothetical protein
MLRISRSFWPCAALAALLAVAGAPSEARAGGFELTAAGTRALGRGGAFAARADDGMALVYNPAMLADLPDSQILLNLHLSFWDACVQRPGTYADGGVFGSYATRFGAAGDTTWAADAMPRVCNGGYPQPGPQLIGSIRILPELAIAFGLVTPAGIANSRWGNDGMVETANGLRPSPVRYALAENDLTLFHPSLGVGWRPISWLRIGLTFQWGMGIIRSTNFTSGSAGGEDPFDDAQTRVEIEDWFVPAGILSAQFQPHPNLDIMIGARLSDAVGGVTDASGHALVTTRYFSAEPASPATTTRIDGVTLRAGQPWQFQAGVRYADRIRPRSWEHGFEAAVRGVVDDSMYSENFDVELDVVYELNSQVGDFVVRLPPGSTVSIDGMAVPVPTTQPVPHGWPDTLGIRLGGDWNIIPGVIAARAGIHTEIPVTTTRFQIQDAITATRVGLHLGATFRIERFDISIAYAHIFQVPLEIADGQFRQVAVSGTQTGAGCGAPGDYDAGSPVASSGCYPRGYGGVVNNGTYTAEFNVLSVGASYHFE